MNRVRKAKGSELSVSSGNSERKALKRFITELEDRKHEKYTHSPTVETDPFERVSEEYRGVLSEEEIEEAYEAALRKERGGNPTRFASWSEALEQHASELEENVRELHAALDADFQGRTQVDSERGNVLHYTVEAQSDPRRLNITVGSSEIRKDRIFTLHASYESDDWEPEWPENEYWGKRSQHPKEERVPVFAHPLFPGSGQLALAEISIFGEDTRAREAYLNDAKNLLKKASYPIRKGLASMYNDMQEPEHKISVDISGLPPRALDPKEFMQWLSEQSGEDLELARAGVNYMKPAVYDVYEENIQRLTGDIGEIDR